MGNVAFSKMGNVASSGDKSFTLRTITFVIMLFIVSAKHRLLPKTQKALVLGVTYLQVKRKVDNFSVTTNIPIISRVAFRRRFNSIVLWFLLVQRHAPKMDCFLFPLFKNTVFKLLLLESTKQLSLIGMMLRFQFFKKTIDAVISHIILGRKKIL